MKVIFDSYPALYRSLKGYTKEQFMKDLVAGTIVGVVALPLAIAFGIASGVSPTQGLVTAIIGGFVAALLTGSTSQISGPTGAFIVIVTTISHEFGFEGLAIATVMAGIILLLMGLLKLGTIIRFIPYPIVIGFTSGIAVTIFTTQVKDLFGLDMGGNSPVGFLAKWDAYIGCFHTLNIWSVIFSLATIVIISLTIRYAKKIPAMLLAIVIMTIISYILKNFVGVSGIETIADRFTIETSLPKPQAIPFTFEAIQQLISPAFTIAILGAIVTLLSATMADGASGERHDSNMELVSQGVANMVVPFFGGIPVTGAVARTMTNIKNGGKSPISAIVHTVVLLLILLFLGGLTRHIPTACLAGVLAVVSYNMSEWRTIRSLCKGSRMEVIVLFTTLFLTVVFSLSLAIEVGMLMAMMLFLQRVSENTNVSVQDHHIDLQNEIDYAADTDKHVDLVKGVAVYEIDGPFFFGIANKFDDLMRRTVGTTKPIVRIIRMRKVPFIDSTGMHNLEMFIQSSQAKGIRIILSGVRPKVKESLERMKIDKLIGEDHVFDHINKAAVKANEIATAVAAEAME